MSEPLIVKNSVTINASANKVWDVLVNPEQTKKYMFGCETLSGWKVGDVLTWEMEYEGMPFIPVKGHIVRIQPDQVLEYTVIDPNSTTIADVPENYLHVTYELEESEGETILTVSQGDFSTVADGERRYQETYNNGEGWGPILVQIKIIAEA